ncbi:MAG: hypothetical protein B6D65_00930 [candidate division Zixibacteria bacterium 4484_93]|nr:MAG: hypothetical protein B6D65_00930 [candidate division Zixibacteria bacterium 4484_93]
MCPDILGEEPLLIDVFYPEDEICQRCPAVGLDSVVFVALIPNGDKLLGKGNNRNRKKNYQKN